jgi:hypothetical protein
MHSLQCYTSNPEVVVVSDQNPSLTNFQGSSQLWLMEFFSADEQRAKGV